MNIRILIAQYKAAVRAEEYWQKLPNAEYSVDCYYHAATLTNKLAYRMINHPDWTAELAAQHYVNPPGSIAYPDI